VREQPKQPPKGAREDVIVFAVGGFRFAIAASAVSEIRSMEGLHAFFAGPSPKTLARVGHTLVRSGVTYFVVDAARHFHLAPSKPGRVLILRQTEAAVLADSTDRMMEISVLHALPLAFTGEERGWYRGLAIMNGEVLPVVNHASFLSKAEMILLKSRAQQKQGAAAG
jgi:chemotaxis signal transduction protein